jgi:hypothetical protein
LPSTTNSLRAEQFGSNSDVPAPSAYVPWPAKWLLRGLFFSLLFLMYNLFMNKRAKKRVKEAIEKDNVEREKIRKDQNHPSAKGIQERRGFTAKPDKKRG